MDPKDVTDDQLFEVLTGQEQPPEVREAVEKMINNLIGPAENGR